MKIIYAPCKDVYEAKKIARELVKARLAVCINIIPSISSVYLWKGKIEEEKESLLIIKTKTDLIEKAITKLKETHSYKLPELIYWEADTTVEINRWINKELNKTPPT